MGEGKRELGGRVSSSISQSSSGDDSSGYGGGDDGGASTPLLLVAASGVEGGQVGDLLPQSAPCPTQRAACVVSWWKWWWAEVGEKRQLIDVVEEVGMTT